MKYILKKDFCNKNKIKIKSFNNILVKQGFLKENIYGRLTKNSSYLTKIKYSLTRKGDKIAYKKSGSNQQGTFKFNESYLNKIFNINK